MASSSSLSSIQLSLTGLNCAGCVGKVEKALRAVSGVAKASVNLADKSATVEASCDTDPLINDQLIKAVEDAGFGASLLVTEQRLFSIASMNCASCVGKIESALNDTAGIRSATVNLPTKTCSVDATVEVADILTMLENAGYPGELVDQQKDLQEKQEREDSKRYRYLIRHTVVALGIGLPLMLWGLVTGEMSVNTPAQQVGWGAVGLVTLLILIFSGSHYFTGMWKALKHGNTNMDTLIAMGTGVAWLYSMLVVLFPECLPVGSRHVYFEASAMIIGLINFGHALELRAKGKTSKALKRLLGLQAKTARVVCDGNEIDIPVEQVRKGDQVRIRPGEKIAVDGLVVEGNSLIDESMLTGEPLAVAKKAGDQVSAGTINKNSTLLFQAEKVGSETTLAHIIALVKKAQGSKLPIARLADRVSSIFVPTVITVALIAAMVWYLFGPSLAHSLVVATTVLIIACPCALGLATPMSVMAGVGRAAELGILIRQGEALQKASKLTTVVLDKTGTITEGAPKVTELLVNQNAKEFDQDRLLTLAASIEAVSEHPLAEAIVDSAKEQQLELLSVSDFEAITGQGVAGKVDGQEILLGNAGLMNHKSVDINSLSDKALKLAEQGQTPMFMAVNGKLAGVISVSDPIREDSISAIQRLHQLGVRVVMLTGDNCHTAAAVAKAVGVDEFQAEVMPEDKERIVRELQQKGELTGMTGDGINDAPALARADVGFAIGCGTDVAIESADITLMRSSLHGLADSIELSRATLKNIKQNLFGAFIYNSLGIPVAAGVLYPLTGMLLNPVIGGAAMALSSVTVVTNANRLRLFKPSESQKL
ncbi:copper-translocating P-type ATPase [Endozoicomonas sp. OPT23]|uniref:heavy metal translocating P-type ATPase n=1 Tax=Endozoicomonas sp. OPT23 TaxID=2072845 RepID=UPI00129B5866|nr:heavy metal translocating P-type ATPase [Endozoicomonas sp. OPT23]MRI31455.1 copper-translocating P-type ATPase [Endozoicomonas sp. OPT23]